MSKCINITLPKQFEALTGVNFESLNQKIKSQINLENVQDVALKALVAIAVVGLVVAAVIASVALISKVIVIVAAVAATVFLVALIKKNAQAPDAASKPLESLRSSSFRDLGASLQSRLGPKKTQRQTHVQKIQAELQELGSELLSVFQTK